MTLTTLRHILPSCTIALADGYNYNSFARMRLSTSGNTVTVKLSKSVDRIFANWPSEFILEELYVDNKLQATVFTAGHSHPMGVVYTDDAGWKWCSDNQAWVRDIAKANDRAIITLQGDWIVCYNRTGNIVKIVRAETKDMDEFRSIAFDY